MSRTDKDAPDWATAEWWEPFHGGGCPHARTWGYVRPRPCNLPASPARHRPALTRVHNLCQWFPVYEHRRNYQGNPPRWYVNHRWTGKDRLRSRVECQTARAQYRATGDVDLVLTVDQHHHGATWDWN